MKGVLIGIITFDMKFLWGELSEILDFMYRIQNFHMLHLSVAFVHSEYVHDNFQ